MNSKRIKVAQMSMNSATTIYSSAYDGGIFDLTNHRTLALTALVAGSTLSGSVKLQYSNDGSNWIDVTSSSQAMGASGGALGFETDAKHSLYRVAVTSANTSPLTVDIIGVAKEQA